ncbi:XRE family transcriptional regulator [Chroococcidiopsis sp. FACHB-1243]|uniref:XRE family transcriptional regulator n=1 Tax=Chroococcidiopsis sp. [FACHB-1243] TaxID=2692781 RepID=UPI00177BC4FB|nr:XRE family transcriptional regulator [Chroococcidiopsis sp. [FACHB-1243]]MBD2309850.1 XRE family transcriptional regulator [Chroococcidiopsis sp. [FACHB-1243]]
MATTLKEKLSRLPKERRQKVKQRSAELVAEEMSRQQLREALKLTQEQMAEILQIDQANVSRLEKRTDLMLSTLRKYITAMGGELRLVIEFPDRPPITLVGISDIIDSEEAEGSVPSDRSNC